MLIRSAVRSWDVLKVELTMPPNDQNPFVSVLARQQAFNRRTRDNVEEFAPHRRRVTAEIVKAAGLADGCVAVLGAGNANDLDLPVLAHAFKEVHLADLDLEALEEVAGRYPDLDGVVRRHGGVDLSGVAARLDRLSETPQDDEIDELVAAAASVRLPDVGFAYGVVASTCLLTQLMNSAVAAVGEGHPRLIEVLEAIRTGHLRLLADLTAAGGTALLFTDVASSDDVPEIATAPESVLPALVARLSLEKRFFLGVDPNQLEKQLRGDPYIAPRVTSVRRLGFWRWRISKARTFLVYAVAFQC